MARIKTILILEDSQDRIADFERAVAELGDGFELRLWRDAPSMIAECEQYFSSAALISLDHDLKSQSGATTNPGTGMDVARFLAEFPPVCPVLLHSSSNQCAFSMMTELSRGGWVADRLEPVRGEWIRKHWLQRAKVFFTNHRNKWSAKQPADHKQRMQRALLSFDGLSVGDGFGECFFTVPDVVERRLQHKDPPPRPWIVTDDTIMALSIVRCLNRYGHIEQDALATAFAQEFVNAPNRGYGGMAVQILYAISEGFSWKAVARQAFNGQGSCGNGGAMRAAPIGAYFADDYDRVIYEAKCSAEITHAHPDGKTGAVAIALAAAWLSREENRSKEGKHDLISFVLEHLERTETYHRLVKALEVDFNVSPRAAASILGNGSRVISSDTVPFCLWCAARHADSYTDALWSTVAGLGDRDTTCAIVGGIVALSAGRESIPLDWLNARETISI